ncbi:hypothetical protein [Parasulfitobacter algicola]|uniref:Uncharacterized protein n=1 Tax=Parasulfitobacter algicola TaxID=2614809 RepID=A0ABX2IW73_9RHOB|nr:hypothetical protein [Sulfitobacter algicola]NSX56555.1 hypothetical protein [Sulfitobacter algicola]
MPTTKVAKCCYCGTKAALVLSGRHRHELACSACGAPLHDLKIMPKNHGGKSTKAYGTPRNRKYTEPAERPQRRRRKKKGLAHRFFEEAFDLVEDIFD